MWQEMFFSCCHFLNLHCGICVFLFRCFHYVVIRYRAREHQGATNISFTFWPTKQKKTILRSCWKLKPFVALHIKLFRSFSWSLPLSSALLLCHSFSHAVPPSLHFFIGQKFHYSPVIVTINQMSS